ncbi:DapH/DapD/GlmU-related protein [Ewingella americana]|uniref:Putative lipopolysaccharide biosynthesis O-acetyl transferase n=1 Tax=Ewingella americana (strain ATCC 33852 / DSM 4580 / CCUG 14506 / JCM 5911 / LMG 7869 / NCTC 12157 / CDC 1468-78) TaxID=910964 RepID=A0A085GHC4_EWIA3|nr:DapH/DapD/GlmU-related protein [Ewingella americana]KFC83119.1 putative lipopolysaccharide biosynthesis O-acetyl transferase [Ewingella americana ATCC 33852]
MISLIKNYGFFGLIKLLRDRTFTFFILNNARIIRFPFEIRGKYKMKIGSGLTTGRYCRLEAYGNINLHSLIIGENCQINDSVHIAAADKISLGNNVLIASRVFITDLNHGCYSGDEYIHSDPKRLCVDRELVTRPVIIGDNVWIGEGAVILPGVVIGDSSIVGANAVVTKSVPPYTIAAGNPAKVVKEYDFKVKKWIKV